jgi:hypothetical protein
MHCGEVRQSGIARSQRDFTVRTSTIDINRITVRVADVVGMVSWQWKLYRLGLTY